MFSGDRPACPRGCRVRMHRHGRYSRYADPTGGRTLSIQRFLCPECGLTISVLPADRLPYRSLVGPRLEAFFNEQARTGSGPDPPPRQVEAGCLRRAWARLRSRVRILREGLCLTLVQGIHSAAVLWTKLCEARKSLPAILGWLHRSHQRSLLGDYRCLRLPA